MTDLLYVAGALIEAVTTKRGLTPTAQAKTNAVARFISKTWQDKLGWGLKAALGIVLMLIEQGFNLPWLVEAAGILQMLIALGQQMGWWEKVSGLVAKVFR